MTVLTRRCNGSCCGSVATRRWAKSLVSLSIAKKLVMSDSCGPWGTVGRVLMLENVKWNADSEEGKVGMLVKQASLHQAVKIPMCVVWAFFLFVLSAFVDSHSGSCPAQRK